MQIGDLRRRIEILEFVEERDTFRSCNVQMAHSWQSVGENRAIKGK